MKKLYKFTLYAFLFLFCIACAGCAGAGKKDAALENLARGEMYHKTGRHKRALKYLNKAAAAGSGEAMASRGALLYDMGRYQDALEDFNAVIAAEPGRAEAYSAAGAAMAALGSYLPARESLLRSLELNPSNAAAHISLGGIYFNTQNYDAAAAEYTKALELRPAGDIYFMRGVCLLYYGKTAAAHEDFKAAGLSEENYPTL
ncbi:MAG: tetratricopeptide repeat protein [Elusimicrobiota bacterium]|jgi:tetratricopeptide (TPR) repeat protein|nr:tetratricopeptide repeat protein [Elusimicrobiota bacterium]